MGKSLNWGLIGTGNIAIQFATGVNVSRRCKLAAVGSRAVQSARAFAQSFAVGSSYGDYESVIADRSVDAIYIALPNSMHREWTIKALAAGKHVLCEKPIASNAAEAEEMFDAAQRAGRVLVEAFMYRAHPLTDAVLGSCREGAVGELKLIRTSFCFRTSRIDGNIRFDAGLAGGALMDIGCYCIDFSRLVAREEPAEIRAMGRMHESGVDELAIGMLRFPSGVVASFTCGMTLHADNTAYICGDAGYIEVPVPWKPGASGAVYTVAHSTPPRMDSADSKSPARPPRQSFSIDAGADLYAVEADDLAATVLDGRAPLMSRADSVGNMRVLDEMRRQVGVPI